MLHRRMTGDAMSERVRRTLVNTLYTHPFSLASGAVIGVLIGLFLAIHVPEPPVIACAVVFSLVGIARVWSSLRLVRKDDTSTHALEFWFEIGAFSYALLFGVIGAMELVYDTPPHVAVD